MISAPFPFPWGQESNLGRLRSEFYRLLAAPAAVGFIIGWTGTDEEKRLTSACIWAILSVAGWLINDLFTRPVVAPLHRRGHHLITVLLAGFFVAAPISVLLNFSFGEVFRLWGIERNGLNAIASLSLGQMASSTIAPLLLWITINVVACHSNGGVLFGHQWRSGLQATVHVEPARSASQPAFGASLPAFGASQPAFMAKVRPALRGRVLAINAELHYVRVYTEHGEDLIHYRFRDAVADMQTFGGIQVHRSWCVAAQEVSNQSARSLTLTNGLTVPIGRAFGKMVARASQT